MVVPNVDNLSLGIFRGLDIERTAVTIEDNYLSRATNVLVRGGDLVKRPPFRKSIDKDYVIKSAVTGTPWQQAPNRALISPIGEAITVGPIDQSGSTFYVARMWSERQVAGPDWETGPAASAAITNRSAPGADFVTVAKVGLEYFFGGPSGLWRLQTPTGTPVWTKISLPDANAGVRQVVYFKNRLWVVADGFNGATKDESLKSRLYYSNPAAPATIASTINIAFNESLGSLKAIVPFSDRILCFTDRSIWNLYLAGDVASWSQRLFLRGAYIGCLNPHCVLEYKGWIYFLNLKGLWRTDGNVLEEVSAPIRKWITSTGSNDPETIQGNIVQFKDHLIVRMNNQVDLAAYNMFLYNMEWDAWTGCLVNTILDQDQGFADALNNFMANVNDFHGEEYVLCGTNGRYMLDYGDPFQFSNPDTYYQDFRFTGVEEHVNYNTGFRTKHYDAGRMPRLKDVLAAQLEMMGSESGAQSAQHIFDGRWYVDSDMSTQVSSRRYEGTETDIINTYMYRFPGPRYGRRFSFELNDSSPGYLKITELNVEVVAKRDDPRNPSY